MAQNLIPTPYPDLNAVLRELAASVQAILGQDFVAVCLQDLSKKPRSCAPVVR